MTAVIDYDAGNLKSVEKALLYLGEKVLITRDPEKILKADHIILPGVGAFGDAMKKLGQYGLTDVIAQVLKEEIPFLGICLGLQLLFEASEENNRIPGLGILKGKIIRFPSLPGLKIPHMGWNSLTIRPGSRLLWGIGQEAYVYFVHSYYLKAEDSSIVAAASEYGVSFHAAVESGNLCACQFHPEKSGETGLKILKNFLTNIY